MLSLEDFKDHPKVFSQLDALVEVVQVATVKYQQEKVDHDKDSVSSGDDDLIILEEECNKNKKNKNKNKNKGKEKEEDNNEKELPDDFKRMIRKMGGSEVSLVMEKTVYSTDVSPQHNRLSVPAKKMKNTDNFLREEEESMLVEEKNKKICKNEKKGLEVILVEPSLETTRIMLAKWDIGSSSCYVLKSNWMKVVRANGIKKDDTIQLWSFRDIHQRLCMALVKLT